MKEEVIRSKYDEAVEMAERMDYLVYKTQHDLMDKVAWENFTGTPWPGSSLPAVDEYILSQRAKRTSKPNK